MKTLGARKLDPLGRITLPMELRRTLGLIAGVKVDMWIEKSSIGMKLFDKNNPKGIARLIDDLGRVTIPMEFRKAIQMDDREKINISLDGPVIYLESGDKCVFCSSTKNLVAKNDKFICPKCIEELRQEVLRG